MVDTENQALLIMLYRFCILIVILANAGMTAYLYQINNAENQMTPVLAF